MIAAAYHYAEPAKSRETITAQSAIVRAADGDSFVIGTRKFRLHGIDAPEWKQLCADAGGSNWQCGALSRRALSALLAQPGLTCKVDAQDRFNRSVATCATANTGDVAAQQVRAGMAITNEFNGLRAYGEEEDAARTAKRGLWQGSFTDPKLWRELNPHYIAAQRAMPIS